MNIFLNGRLLGSTKAGPIALPVGNHDLELISDETGYRATPRVTVKSGATTRIQLRPPRGRININASPWADVYVDKQFIGQTPIGNFQVPIGRREVTLRHPQLGERRVSVVVTLKQPARIGVDLARK